MAEAYFVCHICPIFDLCLHWVSVVRVSIWYAFDARVINHSLWAFTMILTYILEMKRILASFIGSYVASHFIFGLFSSSAFLRRPQKFGVITHLIWRLLSNRQIKWVITPNFCGLLRKAELYLAWFGIEGQIAESLIFFFI